MVMTKMKTVHLQRVLHGAFEDAAFAVMAVAVVVLAQLVYMQGRVDTASNAQRGVNDEAHDHADDDLGADDLEDDVERHLLGQENGQHLVRRGKEHGEQRSQRDDAPRPQRRGGGENPHCGTAPTTAPTTGPAAPAR